MRKAKAVAIALSDPWTGVLKINHSLGAEDAVHILLFEDPRFPDGLHPGFPTVSSGRISRLSILPENKRDVISIFEWALSCTSCRDVIL